MLFYYTVSATSSDYRLSPSSGTLMRRQSRYLRSPHVLPTCGKRISYSVVVQHRREIKTRFRDRSAGPFDLASFSQYRRIGLLYAGIQRISFVDYGSSQRIRERFGERLLTNFPASLRNSCLSSASPEPPASHSTRGDLLGSAAGREEDLRAQGARGLRQRAQGRRVEARRVRSAGVASARQPKHGRGSVNRRLGKTLQ